MPETQPAIEVLVLGTDHLSDWHGSDIDYDILDERRQRELDELAARLARLLKHPRVYAVDADWTLDWVGIKEYVERHPEAAAYEGLSPTAQQTLVEAWVAGRSSTISQILARANESSLVLLNDREYLDRYLMIGEGDKWGRGGLGCELVQTQPPHPCQPHGDCPGV